MKPLVWDASFMMAGANGETAPSTHCQQAATHLINFKTHIVEDLSRTVPPDGWQRLSSGAGTKEAGLARARVELSCHPRI